MNYVNYKDKRQSLVTFFCLVHVLCIFALRVIFANMTLDCVQVIESWTEVGGPKGGFVLLLLSFFFVTCLCCEAEYIHVVLGNM